MQGGEEEKCKIALNLLGLGLSSEQVAAATGLPRAEIDAFREKAK
jgi:predicted transposase YdaD